MAGKAVKAKSPAPDEPILPLVQEIRDLVQGARRAAAQNVNTLQVITNFEIGRRIVEYEQRGSRRAGYGANLLQELSHRLTEEFGRGFSRQISSTCVSFISNTAVQPPTFVKRCLTNQWPSTDGITNWSDTV